MLVILAAKHKDKGKDTSALAVQERAKAAQQGGAEEHTAPELMVKTARVHSEDELAAKGEQQAENAEKARVLASAWMATVNWTRISHQSQRNPDRDKGNEGKQAQGQKAKEEKERAWSIKGII